jgi:hypothetical protein
MILRLTQKLAKKIKAVPAAALPPHDNPLLDWTANLFMVLRWQCIILTNSASLYSVVFPGKGIPDEQAFVEQSMKALDDCLMRDGFISLFETRIVPVIDSVSFCKACDRSVLASMNQLVYQAQCDLLEMGHALPLVNRRLNRIPMSKLKYRYSIEEFAALVNRSCVCPDQLSHYLSTCPAYCRIAHFDLEGQFHKSLGRVILGPLTSLHQKLQFEGSGY